ncbi:hypothetical protein GOODEAATRI_010095 [Goodea atripinnis]|uniref:Transposase n=1 Tax=Goodea atripinnis TaxID=208336 RepID=A0ABV0N397_9TELE
MKDLCLLLVLQHETRVLRVKVIAGIDLAKKDIIGARQDTPLNVQVCASSSTLAAPLRADRTEEMLNEV